MVGNTVHGDATGAVVDTTTAAFAMYTSTIPIKVVATSASASTSAIVGVDVARGATTNGTAINSLFTVSARAMAIMDGNSEDGASATAGVDGMIVVVSTEERRPAMSSILSAMSCMSPWSVVTDSVRSMTIAHSS
ncbi:hypothetical protein PR202_gb29546 [Eleusine coracana subsp. coracana]|uniref:Uncharacterized protein n=1 Tax=Eleusine coracana subsp. coracana TaxID=191504 RepID=A0AAV5FZP4_ELECO|nr:hypothetical protein PR202_gb29546 [Eleusine coracana subsp. coracana]